MVSDTHFLERDATADNDIALPKHYTHTLTELGVVETPSLAFGIPLTLAVAGYQRRWIFPDVVLTRTEHDAVVALAVTEVGVGSTYPRLNVMDAYGTPNTWDVFAVRVSALVDGSVESEAVSKRLCTLTFTLRGTTGGFSFVVDSGGANSVTLTLDSLESVTQMVQLAHKGVTLTGVDPLAVVGEPPIEAQVSGWCATTDLDKLQKVLDAVTPVEMVGAAFDTAGSGYFSTELPSTTTAILQSLTLLEKRGALAHVQLAIVRDTTP